MTKFSTVFVTVGTTKFDGLLAEVDTVEFQSFLASSLGTTSIIVQYGSSEIIPKSRISSISVVQYAFKPNLTADILNCDLVIAHCGGGTILEILRLEKKALCVVNSSLLDNHQIEIADEMKSRSLMRIAYSTKSMLDVLKNSDWTQIKLYEKPDSTALLKEVATLVDF